MDYLVITAVLAFGIYKIWPFIKMLVVELKYEGILLKDNTPLTEDEQRKVLVGAMYTMQQTGYLNTLETGVNLSRRVKILHEWWGIYNKEQALSTLDYLRDQGFRFYFPEVYKAFMNKDKEAAKIELESAFDDEEDQEKALSQLENLEKCFDTLKQDKIIADQDDVAKVGVVGWDAGRLSFMARLCRDAKLISDEETWEYLDAAYQMAKDNFSEWEIFSKSYNLGRAMWSGDTTMTSMSESLLTSERSPWKKIPLK